MCSQLLDRLVLRDVTAGENRWRMRKSHFISQTRVCENHTSRYSCPHHEVGWAPRQGTSNLL
jgi:hypothetical protein